MNPLLRRLLGMADDSVTPTAFSPNAPPVAPRSSASPGSYHELERLASDSIEGPPAQASRVQQPTLGNKGKMRPSIPKRMVQGTGGAMALERGYNSLFSDGAGSEPATASTVQGLAKQAGQIDSEAEEALSELRSMQLSGHKGADLGRQSQPGLTHTPRNATEKAAVTKQQKGYDSVRDDWRGRLLDGELDGEESEELKNMRDQEKWARDEYYKTLQETSEPIERNEIERPKGNWKKALRRGLSEFGKYYSGMDLQTAKDLTERSINKGYYSQLQQEDERIAQATAEQERKMAHAQELKQFAQTMRESIVATTGDERAADKHIAEMRKTYLETEGDLNVRDMNQITEWRIEGERIDATLDRQLEAKRIEMSTLTERLQATARIAEGLGHLHTSGAAYSNARAFNAKTLFGMMEASGGFESRTVEENVNEAFGRIDFAMKLLNAENARLQGLGDETRDDWKIEFNPEDFTVKVQPASPFSLNKNVASYTIRDFIEGMRQKHATTEDPVQRKMFEQAHEVLKSQFSSMIRSTVNSGNQSLLNMMPVLQAMGPDVDAAAIAGKFAEVDGKMDMGLMNLFKDHFGPELVDEAMNEIGHIMEPLRKAAVESLEVQ